MENLNENQKLVIKFLTKNENESFNMTQIGVQAGKKIPKSASTWSKPLLESLVKLGLIQKIEKDGKFFFQLLKISLKEEENSKETKTLIQKEKKEKIKKEKTIKVFKQKNNLLSKIDIEDFNLFLFQFKDKVNLEEKNKTIKFLNDKSSKFLLEKGLNEKSLKANQIKGFIFKSIKKVLGEDYETRTDGRNFMIGEIVKFKGGKTSDKEGRGEILQIKYNHFGHRYMRLEIEGGLVIDKTDKFLIKL